MENDFLHNRKDGFKLPENYFDKFEEQLMQAISEEQLMGVSKESGFKVPDAYFEDVELSILATIEKEKAIGKVHFLKANYKYLVGTVAAILIVVLSVINIPKGVDNVQATELGSVSGTEIENYLQEGYIQVNSYELGEIFSDELSDVSVTASIDENVLIEYLSEYDLTLE